MKLKLSATNPMDKMHQFKHAHIPIKTQPVQPKAILTNKMQLPPHVTNDKHSKCHKLPLTATTLAKKARKEANLLDKKMEAENLPKATS